jgi:hypothetical protein
MKKEKDVLRMTVASININTCRKEQKTSYTYSP